MEQTLILCPNLRGRISVSCSCRAAAHRQAVAICRCGARRPGDECRPYASSRPARNCDALRAPLFQKPLEPRIRLRAHLGREVVLDVRMLHREPFGHAVQLKHRPCRRDHAIDTVPFEIRIALRRECVLSLYDDSKLASINTSREI